MSDTFGWMRDSIIFTLVWLGKGAMVIAIMCGITGYLMAGGWLAWTLGGLLPWEEITFFVRVVGFSLVISGLGRISEIGENQEELE